MESPQDEARAVLVGRPVLGALCIAGEQGRTNVLEILRRELDEARLLHGCTNLSHVSRCLLAHQQGCLRLELRRVKGASAWWSNDPSSLNNSHCCIVKPSCC